MSANPFEAVESAPATQALRQGVEQGGVLSCPGVSSGGQSFFAVLLRQLFPGRPLVVVTAGLKIQESFQQDVETWLALEMQIQSSQFKDQGSCAQPLSVREPMPKEDIKASARQTTPQSTIRNPQSLFYPAWETFPHEAKLPHADVISERLETLVTLASTKITQHAAGAPLIVTSVAALVQRTFPAEILRERTRPLGRGDRLDPLDLIEWLEAQGYEPEAQVTQKGEIALRGGIVDLFPLTSPWPVRLEFFGDELESLRYFDPFSQVSKEEISCVMIPPGGELGILKRMLEGETVAAGFSRRSHDANPERNLKIAATAPAALATLLDYLPPETIFLLCEPELLIENAELYAKQVPPGDPFFIAWKEFREQITAKGMSVLEMSEVSVIEGDGSPSFSMSSDPEEQDLSQIAEPVESGIEPLRSGKPQFKSLDAYRPLGAHAPDPQIAEAQRRQFFVQLHRWLRQGYAVHVFCNNEGERQRFTEVWQEFGFDEPPQTSKSNETTTSASASVTRPAPRTPHHASRITSHLGALTRGFLFDEGKLVVITDAEIFGRYKVQRPRRLKSPHAQTSRSLLDIDFTDLQEGDYVVHLQHGIGRYLGLKVLPIAAGRKGVDQSTGSPLQLQNEMGEECLVIEYAPRDPEQPPPKLYVPVTEAHLVSKYVGAGKSRPPLNLLGGLRWHKAKAQAVEAVRDLASEFLAIQAARESQPGHAFAVDNAWQREFESSFLYEETPDQMRAIVESKKDMESAKPMDRLICGDVGYGKTEVAIRAAFKAVMGGKQVAILVPTTVLAQQHFNTFRERMSDYPIRIELLSRFRTRREQQHVIQDLAAGSVDIVIGTHRLVQADIAFKDLGLVVIDEEQRFGVLHKEKFKQLRKLVDVLTLSATPIPRTLYLALTGARDMSTIETPPQDRLPVETIVAQYDERLIRDAIQRELNRQGQVFFLYNRVDTIDAVALRLRGLVPHARIVVGHGQMHSDDLEEVMTRFVNGEADVLLSTTIIESGLDIPNANTIIIDRADRFGLSELYQLRGRVGRYKHQAFAYLLLPRHAGLLSDARKRINAIKQYSSLGSGFKIAMRDLEIRGAGNLLGPQQSGHITAVGFELYCQLLKQSVSTLKGEKVKPRVEVQVRLDFVALSPGEDDGSAQNEKSKSKNAEPDVAINVPREVGTYVTYTGEAETQSAIGNPKSAITRTGAYIPFRYIGDARQRIEIYRKLAQASDKLSLQRLAEEMRDRFGPLPPAMELLLQLAELKLLASERGITAIETKADKLMLTRNHDLITLGGKFPRLAKKSAKARLGEIKRLLLRM